MVVGMDCETEGLKPGPVPYVVALWDTRCGKAATFLDNGTDESSVLEATLAMKNARELCTFNGTQFDFKMMAASCTHLSDKRDLARLALEHTDIMLQFACSTGYYGSLDSFAGATLGAKKIGCGADVNEDWKAGKRQEVADYCADDARLTGLLYDHGRGKGYLLRTPKSKPDKVSRWALGADLWQPAHVCLRNPKRATFMEDPPDVGGMGDWALEYL